MPMEIQRYTCPTCGASLTVPGSASQVTCDYCGNTLAVTRSGKGATLELAQQVTETVAASSESTRSAIEDASQITRAELRRLQLTQELTTAQLQLTNIRREIRALEREKSTPKVRRQLRELRQKEEKLKEKINKLYYRLNPQKKPKVVQKPKASRKSSSGCAGILAGLGLLMLLASFAAETSEDAATVAQVAIVLVLGASLWQIFNKAGAPGWAAVVPFYNVVVLAEVVGRPWWWVLLLFVPIAQFIVLILLAVDLARSFGKGIGFAIGMVFLPFIFFPILAFGSAEYLGPAAAS